MTATPHDDARARLRGLFEASTGSEANRKWDGLWQQGDFLPWDKGTFHPALEDLFKIHQGLVPSSKDESGQRRRALIPGCGSGYDVLLLAALGFDAYGLEVSSNAIKVCEKLREAQFAPYCKQVGSTDVGTATFLIGDFFDNDWQSTAQLQDGFDVIWDYTFLCALSPSLRPAWAQRHSQLLRQSAEARLICLEHPLSKAPSTEGPPHGLSPEIYLGHLHRPGRDLLYTAEGWPDSTSILQESKGLERVTRLQPERTHANGKSHDGVVVDRLSVWKHVN